MKCPKCKHENPPNAKFCMDCGAKLENMCPKCGSKLPSEARFCMECGSKIKEASASVTLPTLEEVHAQSRNWIPEALAQKYLAAEQQITGENRPITALFADISGSTQLASTRTSEAMFGLVQDCFKELVGIIANYEGRISGFRGDGLLALFGAPILHENDAERAILAALEMHNAMQKQQLRVTIGINTALMTVGEIQTQLYSEYTAYGTDIVLARRLQENAQPGQILVGSGTHRLTRHSFDFETLDPINVKGFLQPVSAYIVKQVKSHPEKLRGIEGLRARMIGREHEFTELKEATDEWLSGHGQIVSVIGEAGIGKSRLVRELKEYLGGEKAGEPEDRKAGERESQKAGILVMEGRCVSIGQPISYWPFIDILKTYFNLREGDDTATIARKVTDSITQLMPQGADETLPLLGQLLSIKYGNELDDRLKFAAPEQIRHQTLMRLRDIFETLAKQKPLLIILEDLHWSDDLSLDLISLLMDELANTPLMMLCVYRPEHDHRVWQLGNQARRKCMDRYCEIILKPLSSIESRELIESLLTIDNLPEDTKLMILNKSEGNPFFIEEVIRSLIEQDMIYREDERWKARDEISGVSVPDTIQSVILSRVDRLQAEAKYVLQCASVIGRLFKHRLLDHLTQHERELNRYISEFENRELVYQERLIPELEYAFKHALTQEATYQSILERKRREFHLQAAQGIERLYQERLEEFYEELAEHYSKSDDTGKAVEYLIKAGEKANKRYANAKALEYYNQALKYVKTDSEYISIIEYRTKLLLELFRGKEAVKDYGILLENAKQNKSSKKEIESLIGLASAYYIISLDESNYALKSFDLFNQAYNLAREHGEKDKMAKALLLTVDFMDHFPEFKKQIDANVEEALTLSLEIGDEELIIDSKVAMTRSLRWLMGQRKNCKQLAKELAQQLKSRNDLVRLNYVYWNLMCVTLSEGSFEECIKYCDMGIHLASELGILPVQYPTLKAYALMKLGRFGESWESLQDEIADENHLFGKSQKYLGMGEYFFELMSYKKSIEIYKYLIGQGKQLGRPWIVNISMYFYAKSLLYAGNFGEIDLNEAIKTIENTEAEFKLDIMAEIELAKGNLNEALNQAKESYLLEENWQSNCRCVIVLELQTRILIKRGEFQDAIAIADKGIRLAEKINYLPMLWRIYALKAQALGILGKKEEARQEYESSAKIIKHILGNISNEEDKNDFLSNPSVSSVINYLGGADNL